VIENILLKTRKMTEYVVFSMIIIMTLIICYQVFSRFVLNYTPTWIQPLSLLLMVWIGFIGVAIGIQDNSHIQINLVVSKFPKTIQIILRKLQRFLALVFGLFMLVEGIKFSYNMKDSYISGLSLPSAVLYAVVPLSGLLVFVYLLFEFTGKWHGVEEEGVGEE